MKKIYFAPETKIVKIATVRMFAESLGKSNAAGLPQGDPDKSLSRRGSSWDDEE